VLLLLLLLLLLLPLLMLRLMLPQQGSFEMLGHGFFRGQPHALVIIGSHWQ